MKKLLIGVAVIGVLALIGKLVRKHPADEHFDREAAARQAQAG